MFRPKAWSLLTGEYMDCRLYTTYKPKGILQSMFKKTFILGPGSWCLVPGALVLQLVLVLSGGHLLAGLGPQLHPGVFVSLF